MEITKQISKKLDLPLSKVQSTTNLLKAENTIPFIARYRKEVTGNLDEVQIREINDTLIFFENLEKRRETILKQIRNAGKLTPELKQQLLQADTPTLLEDLYMPYRPKKKTRAMAAREKGLEPLADLIIQQPVSNKASELLPSYLVNNDMDQESMLSGACDIIAESVSENSSIRQTVREYIENFGEIICKKISKGMDERLVYKDYYKFTKSLNKLQPHQILAINRGEKEKILRVSIHIEEDAWKSIIYTHFPPNKESNFYEPLISAIEDGAKRLLLPSIYRDLRRDLTAKAEKHAVRVFSKNLRALLAQPPISNHYILGIDPGFRTGCKVAVIDPNGKLLDTATIYPHPPQNNLEQAYIILMKLIGQYKISLIVIGNGTASRETEQLISTITKKETLIKYMITNEAGASVYSASSSARKEFPDLDVSMRGAVSIARRIQDPLAEFVKIDPKSVGIGLYQHDLNQSELSAALDQVVESVVNSVGVELNTASVELLSYVAGIGPFLAEKIVAFRDLNGPFTCLDDILQVQGLGPRTFEQAAGFLRIRDSINPLDATGIHPESYSLAYKIMDKFNISCDVKNNNNEKLINDLKTSWDLEDLSNSFHTGLATITDILDELSHPGRDPRDDLPRPILRSDVVSMNDLTPGMQLKGTIRNVVDFGAFVDIGVKIDGLLHRSRILDASKIKVGDIVNVTILSVDHDRNRIALMMKE